MEAQRGIIRERLTLSESGDVTSEKSEGGREEEANFRERMPVVSRGGLTLSENTHSPMCHQTNQRITISRKYCNFDILVWT